MNTIFILLILFQLKHFLADYPLQGKYMLGKFKSGYDWIMPLLAHVAVHGFFTLMIVSIYKPKLAIPMALLDMVLHFIMDRIKASPTLLGKYQPLTKEEYKELEYNLEDATFEQDEKWIKIFKKRFQSNVYFWWALGLDQGVHHLTHYLIIYLVVS